MKIDALKKYFASYGIDPDIRRDVREAVWRENLRSTKFFVFTGAVGLVLCALSPLLYEKMPMKAVGFLICAAACFMVYFIVLKVSSNESCTEKQARILLWMTIIVMFIGQQYVGCISVPTRMSTIYHALLLYTMALFVFEPRTAFFGPICSTMCFITIELFVKSPELVLADGINSIFSTGMGIIVGIYTSRVRMNGFAARCREVRQNEQLRTAVEVARAANKAKSNFMSQMSHEIRTPLNAVIGYNTLARNVIADAKTDEELRAANVSVTDFLTKSEFASKHLLTVINDVLDMSAVESGMIKIANDRFDFKSLISSLTVLFYSQAKAKGIDFEAVFDSPTEEWFIGDQMRINQALTNILSNAVKFTADGGRVRLKIISEAVDDNHMKLCFEVTDTGIGMSREFIGRLWKPFEQADSSILRRFGGTGLGLAITKSLVDIMHGEISVESEPGVGSVFTVKLTVGRTEQPSTASSSDFTEVKALIADEDEDTREYLGRLFECCGARSETVGSAAEAASAFGESVRQNAPFTLCLIGRCKDETALIKEIRESAGDNAPVIAFTAYDYTEIADKAKAAGSVMFIAKPLFKSSLYELMSAAYGGSKPKAFVKKDIISFHGARVLLAEDNMMNMEVAKRILEAAGLAVDSAWNGREAVSMFEEQPAWTYKAILMDVHMPEMDGYQATKAIRASRHSESMTVPIIAMTADAFAENIAEAYAAGMNDHISKPIDINLLLATLSKYIRA